MHTEFYPGIEHKQVLNLLSHIRLNPERQSFSCSKEAGMVKPESGGLQLLSLADIKVFIIFYPEVNSCQKLWFL